MVKDPRHHCGAGAAGAGKGGMVGAAQKQGALGTRGARVRAFERKDPPIRRRPGFNTAPCRPSPALAYFRRSPPAPYRVSLRSSAPPPSGCDSARPRKASESGSGAASAARARPPRSTAATASCRIRRWAPAATRRLGRAEHPSCY